LKLELEIDNKFLGHIAVLCTEMRPIVTDQVQQSVCLSQYSRMYVCILRARVQPTLDPYAEAFL